MSQRRNAVFRYAQEGKESRHVLVSCPENDLSAILCSRSIFDFPGEGSITFHAHLAHSVVAEIHSSAWEALNNDTLVEVRFKPLTASSPDNEPSSPPLSVKDAIVSPEKPPPSKVEEKPAPPAPPTEVVPTPPLTRPVSVFKAPRAAPSPPGSTSSASPKVTMPASPPQPPTASPSAVSPKALSPSSEKLERRRRSIIPKSANPYDVTTLEEDLSRAFDISPSAPLIEARDSHSSNAVPDSTWPLNFRKEKEKVPEEGVEVVKPVGVEGVQEVGSSKPDEAKPEPERTEGSKVVAGDLVTSSSPSSNSPPASTTRITVYLFSPTSSTTTEIPTTIELNHPITSLVSQAADLFSLPNDRIEIRLTTPTGERLIPHSAIPSSIPLQSGDRLRVGVPAPLRSAFLRRGSPELGTSSSSSDVGAERPVRRVTMAVQPGSDPKLFRRRTGPALPVAPGAGRALPSNPGAGRPRKPRFDEGGAPPMPV